MRLLISCVPGIDPASVFSVSCILRTFINPLFQEPENFVPHLYTVALKDTSTRMIQAYSIGLIASAMEVHENAGKYRWVNFSWFCKIVKYGIGWLCKYFVVCRPQNTCLIRTALQRLKELRELEATETARSASSENNVVTLFSWSHRDIAMCILTKYTLFYSGAECRSWKHSWVVEWLFWNRRRWNGRSWECDENEKESFWGSRGTTAEEEESK